MTPQRGTMQRREQNSKPRTDRRKRDRSRSSQLKIFLVCTNILVPSTRRKKLSRGKGRIFSRGGGSYRLEFSYPRAVGHDRNTTRAVSCNSYKGRKPGNLPQPIREAHRVVVQIGRMSTALKMYLVMILFSLLPESFFFVSACFAALVIHDTSAVLVVCSCCCEGMMAAGGK